MEAASQTAASDVAASFRTTPSEGGTADEAMGRPQRSSPLRPWGVSHQTDGAARWLRC